MEISIQSQRNRLKFLVPVLGLIILITILVFWRGLFLGKGPERIIINSPAEIKINFNILKSQDVADLEEFEQIPSFEGTPGKENPFLP